MKYRVAFTRRAQADLHGLFDYLADRFNSVNAQHYVEQIEKTCLGLGTMPLRGTERSDLRPVLLRIGFRRRITIAFRVKEDSEHPAYSLWRPKRRSRVSAREALKPAERSHYFGGCMLYMK